ncbi:MAG: ECF-type sigma factor [Pirellulaceae bacterium]
MIGHLVDVVRQALRNACSQQSTPRMNSVSLLIDQIKNGNDDAAMALWARYYQQLVLLARRKLGTTPRRIMDEDDVAQTAFASFCRRAAEGKFPNLRDRDDLWRLLICIAERKALNQRKHLGRRKNSALTESALLAAGDRQQAMADIAAPMPTPELAAIVAEQVTRLLEQLPEEVLRSIVIQKMEGYTNREIARSLQCSISSIERKLRRIRTLIGEFEAEDEPTY